MTFKRKGGYFWMAYQQYGTFRAWDFECDSGVDWIVCTIRVRNNPKYPNNTHKSGWIRIVVQNFKDVELHEIEFETNLILSGVDVTFFKVYLLRMLNYTSI